MERGTPRAMPSTRRSFLNLAAGVVALAGSGVPKGAWAQTSLADPRRFATCRASMVNFCSATPTGKPSLRTMAATSAVHPIAVLRPRTNDDIVRMVGYANKHSLKIAMRGRGHSQYGQSQVEGGIVIDSSTLNAVRWHGNDAIDAQPGTLWGDVAKNRSRGPHSSRHGGRDDSERGRHAQCRWNWRDRLSVRRTSRQCS